MVRTPSILSDLIVPYWFVLEGCKWNATRAEALAPPSSRLPPPLSLRTLHPMEMNEPGGTKTLLRSIKRRWCTKDSDSNNRLRLLSICPSIRPAVTPQTRLLFPVGLVPLPALGFRGSFEQTHSLDRNRVQLALKSSKFWVDFILEVTVTCTDTLITDSVNQFNSLHDSSLFSGTKW